MFFLSVFSPKSIGPVWPAMLLCFAYMVATTAFLILARTRAWFRAFTLREYRFLQRLYDATEMFSTLAILSGMIGTGFGLLEVLPVLGNSMRDPAAQGMLEQVLGPLRNVWASTIAGLILGGLWGEIILFILKPYTRPTLMPLSASEPTTDAYDYEEPENDYPSSSEDQNLDNDWRQHDHEGMY